MTEKSTRLFPGMNPGMPNMPNIPNMPNTPNMPGFPNAPQMPGVYPPPPFKLAHAYVPWQYLNQIYNPTEGLAHGTIFPELVFPYKGR